MKNLQVNFTNGNSIVYSTTNVHQNTRTRTREEVSGKLLSIEIHFNYIMAALSAVKHKITRHYKCRRRFLCIVWNNHSRMIGEIAFKVIYFLLLVCVLPGN